MQAKAKVLLMEEVRHQGTLPSGVKSWDGIAASLARHLLGLRAHQVELRPDPVFAVIEEARRLCAGHTSRLDYLLRGEGRQLASSFLRPEQRGGLVRLQAAVSQAEHAQTAMPTWLADVERGGFDPNRIASSLFGSGVPGARPGAINEARAAKGFLGDGSQEWSALRQAAVQRVTGAVDQSVGRQDRGSGPRLRGRSWRRPRPRAVHGCGARANAPVRGGPALDAAAGRDDAAGCRPGGCPSGPCARCARWSGVAFKVGGVPAAAGAYGAKVGQRALIGGPSAVWARRSFESEALRERLPAPPPAVDVRRLGTGTALAAEYEL